MRLHTVGLPVAAAAAVRSQVVSSSARWVVFVVLSVRCFSAHTYTYTNGENGGHQRQYSTARIARGWSRLDLAG